MSDAKRPLRSAQWFGAADKNGFMYRSWMKNQGIPDHEFQGKPIIGICNTWSELTPCNAHFRKLAEHVKRGVFEALADDAPSYVDGSTPGIPLKAFYAVSIDPDSGNSLLSEDYHFCKMARDRGFKIYAAPWVRLNHTGTYIFGNRGAGSTAAESPQAPQAT